MKKPLKNDQFFIKICCYFCFIQNKGRGESDKRRRDDNEKEEGKRMTKGKKWLLKKTVD